MEPAGGQSQTANQIQLPRTPTNSALKIYLADKACRLTELIASFSSQFVAGSLSHNQRLKTPHEIQTTRPDNLRSVERVEQKALPKRGRSRTTIRKTNSFSLLAFNRTTGRGFKRRITFNSISKLQEQESESDPQSVIINSQKVEYRAQKLKSTTQPRKQLDYSSKNDDRKNGKIKFCYNYHGTAQRVKSKPKGHLINAHKSLDYELLKRVETKKKTRKQTLVPITIQTKKVMERKPNKRMRKKRRTTIVAPVQDKPPKVDVQFSNVNDLSSDFQCQEGVCFSGANFVLRRKKYSRASLTISPAQRKYSKAEFEGLKTKLSSPSQETTAERYHTIQEQRSQSLPQVSLSSGRTKTQSKGTLRQHNVITVKDHSLLQEMLSDSQNQPSFKQKTKLTERNTSNCPQTLSPIDQFNINYLRNVSRKNIENTKAPESFRLPRINRLEEIKNPMMRNRQRLKKKQQIISDINKKDSNLRHSLHHPMK